MPSFHQSSSHNRTPGRRFAASLKEASIPFTAVEPLPPATCRRPGPACELEDEVFQNPLSGKYADILSTSPAVPYVDSSTTSPIQVHSTSSFWNPGRILAASRKEASIPLTAVEPLPPATSSRPGPVCELEDGVFRAPTIGKYADFLSTFSAVQYTASSTTSSIQISSTSLPWTPGRILAASRKEGSTPLAAVEPLPPATSSRPGPACELEDGFFRIPTIGKYAVFSSSSSAVPYVDSRSHIPEDALTDSRLYDLWRAAGGDFQVALAGPSRSSTCPSSVPFPRLTVEASLSNSGHEYNVCSTSHPTKRNGHPPGRMQSDVSVYYQNVGGMNSTIEDYRLAIMDHCYDIIVLTETWLDSRTVSSYIFGDGYDVFRCDRTSLNSRKSTGGGVLIAVSSRLKAIAIENDSWSAVEQVWVAIQLADRQLYVCAIYLPPDRTRDMELIDTHCRSVSSISENAAPCDEVMILGDFNLSNIAWKQTHSGFFCPDHGVSSFHTAAIKLLDGYSIASLYQINGVTNENNRSLDLCFVSGRDTAPSTSMAPVPLVKRVPHHPPLLVMFEETVAYDYFVAPAAVAYDFRRADHRSIEEVLSHINWELILDAENVNLASQTLSHVLAYVIDRHVPKKAIRQRSRVPWMSRELRSLKTAKKAVFKKFAKTRTLPLKQHYVRLNQEYKRLNKSRYRHYQRGIERKFKSHPKLFWNYINEQRKEYGLPSSMVLDGITASTQKDICQLFSRKFSSVFSEETLPVDQISLAAENVPLSSQTLGTVEITDAAISDAALQLKTTLNPGPDGFPAALLKKHIAVLLPPLRRIFQLSISSGTFPSCWKCSQMFPVYKKGNKRDINNYRGITSLSAVSKLFELVVMEPMMSHCKQYLSADQHGFTEGRSTTTNLLCLTSFITDSMTERFQTDVIYTDLSAAFDKVNHAIAIAKFDRLGICGNLLNWFQSYLTDRQLMVTIGDCQSTSFYASSGIPQGSHLGPLVFLLYFNDVHTVIKGPRLSYADDLKIYLKIRSDDDCLFLQSQLDALASWCTLNRMVINPAKCSVITFTRKKQPVVFDYELLGTTLERVNHVKDLGVILDSQLTYKQHISYIVDKASRTLGIIFRIAKNFSDVYCLKSLYCSIVRSTLEYCSAVWSPRYNNGVDRVERIQRRFLRFALRKLPWRDPYRLPSYESRCQLIDLEPLRVRRNVDRALVIADVLQGRIKCEAILEAVNLNVRPRLLRNNMMLRLPQRRTNYGSDNALNGLQRVFNRVASEFDFHLSRNVLKRKFSIVYADEDA